MRASWEKNIRVSVRKETSIYKDFDVFMRDNENKAEIFQMIASTSKLSNSLSRAIIATIQHSVLYNKQEMLDELQPCNHEEAHYRLLLHVYDVFQKGFRKWSIITVDMDVVVVALYHFLHFSSMSCRSNLKRFIIDISFHNRFIFQYMKLFAL